VRSNRFFGSFYNLILFLNNKDHFDFLQDTSTHHNIYNQKIKQAQMGASLVYLNEPNKEIE
jgi:hypothetical protein